MLLVVVGSFSASVGFAQTDSTFSVMRNGVEAKFPFTKFTRAEQFKTVHASLPLYSFNQTQYNRIKALLINFAQLENECKLLQANHHDADSVYKFKEKVLTENAKLEQERAKNFETSYHQLLGINGELNDQLKVAEQLAIREHRKRNLKTILVGALALSAGVVIGASVR